MGCYKPGYTLMMYAYIMRSK